MHPCCRWWSKAIECQHSQLPTDPSAARVFYLSSPPVIQSSARQKLFDTHLLQGGERQRSIAMTHTARRSNLVVEMIFPFFSLRHFIYSVPSQKERKNLWLPHESRYDCTFNEMIIAVLSGRHRAQRKWLFSFFLLLLFLFCPIFFSSFG